MMSFDMLMTSVMEYHVPYAVCSCAVCNVPIGLLAVSLKQTDR